MAISFKITSLSSPNKNTYSISFDTEKILIGRSDGCDIILPNPFVSYHHAFIEFKDSSYFLIDLNSKNGTYLNSKKAIAHKRYKLASGDSLIICSYKIDVNLAVANVDENYIEKTNLIARQLFLDEHYCEEDAYPPIKIKLLKGKQQEKEFKFNSIKQSIKIGTSKQCDIIIDEKLPMPFEMTIKKTPLGWKLLPGNGSLAHLKHIKLPLTDILHSGSKIKIASSLLIFLDSIEEELSRLKSTKETESKKATNEPATPAGLQTEVNDESAPITTAEVKTQHRREKGEVAHSRAYKIPLQHSTYKIVAIGISIIAFLISTFILIMILF